MWCSGSFWEPLWKDCLNNDLRFFIVILGVSLLGECWKGSMKEHLEKSQKKTLCYSSDGYQKKYLEKFWKLEFPETAILFPNSWISSKIHIMALASIATCQLHMADSLPTETPTFCLLLIYIKIHIKFSTNFKLIPRIRSFFLETPFLRVSPNSPSSPQY